MPNCSVCGWSFTAPFQRTGRPRTRCDYCRSNHDRADGTAWRTMRARVLREEPVCCVPGCGRLSNQVDHVIPLKLNPDLALVRSNLRGMCGPHNASKGAKVPGSYVPASSPVRSGRPPCVCGDPACQGRWHL